jgi:hypothetical protein
MASITITTTAPQDTRISAAFTAMNGTAPSAADVKNWLISQLRNAVQQYERNQAAEAAATPFDPS